jgi:hypothetical protein
MATTSNKLDAYFFDRRSHAVHFVDGTRSYFLQQCATLAHIMLLLISPAAHPSVHSQLHLFYVLDGIVKDYDVLNGRALPPFIAWKL